jgi:hypothetical protein
MKSLVTSLVLLPSLAVPAAAVEVQLGWDSDVEYDSQVLADDDVIFRFGPTVEISGERRRFSYEFSQTTQYEKYLDHSGLDDFRLRANGSARYTISPRAVLDVSNRFYQTPLLRSGEQLESPEEIAEAAAQGLVIDPTFEGDTGRLISNSFSTGLTLTPVERLTLTGRVNHLYRNFDDENLNAQDTSAVSVISQGTYRALEHHEFGAGFRFTQRDFEGLQQSDEENQTTTYNAFAVWNWTIDERSTFSLTAGPAWSENEPADPDLRRYPTIPGSPTALPNPATCPLYLINGNLVVLGGFPLVFVDSRCQPIDQAPLTEDQQEILADLDAGFVDVRGDPEDETDVNVFFTLRLDRNWDRLSLQTLWSRSDSQTQALGSSTVVDSFFFGSSYRLTRRLQIAGSFRFTRRDTDSDQEFLTPLIPLAMPAPIPELSGIDGVPVVAAAPRRQEIRQTIDSYVTELRLSQDWGRHSNVYALARYYRSESEFEVNGVGASSSLDQWQVLFGVVYRLKPFRF